MKADPNRLIPRKLAENQSFYLSKNVNARRYTLCS